MAIDLARPVFSGDWIPVLIAAPEIRRYQFYGTLFAAGPGGTFRLDRHPVRAIAVALPHRVRARDGGLFDDAEEFEREISFHGYELAGGNSHLVGRSLR